MTEAEELIVKRAVKRKNGGAALGRPLTYKAETTYVTQGNFTIAILKTGKDTVRVGVAKRNAEDDPFLEDRGREIALARAAKAEGVKI